MFWRIYWKLVNPYAGVSGSEVMLGPGAKHLPVDELAAMIAHEHGHVLMRHARQRIVWLLTGKWLRPQRWLRMCQEQEFQADRYAVLQGHGVALLRFIRKRSPEYGGPFHPPRHQRLARIHQILSNIQENAP